MKIIILVACQFLLMQLFAQPKTITNAVITTLTTIITPDDNEATSNSAALAGNSDEVRTMRFGADGETKTTTYLKGKMIKTVNQSDRGVTTIIRDGENKKTTTLLEMMGKKTGFYITDEEQEQVNKRMDSLVKSRNSDQNNSAETSVQYLDESKKIAGLNCKKGILISTRNNGKTDSTIVWYYPGYRFEGLTSTGGMNTTGGMNRSRGINGLSMIGGFPMQYEVTMRRGRKMIVEVTRIDVEKEIKDKEFEIPKDFELKPLKDMQSETGNGRIQMRIER